MSFTQIQSFRCTYNTITYTWRIPLLSPCIPLAFLPLAVPLLHPFVFPLYSLLLTWHPPGVIGIVHLPLWLRVN